MTTKCSGFEQNPETGMIRTCTKESRHLGPHKHKPCSLDTAINKLQCNSHSPLCGDRCILPYGHKGDHSSMNGTWTIGTKECVK